MVFVPLLAFPNPFAPILVPITTGLGAILGAINNVTHNIGLSLVLLAVLIGSALWPLRAKQYQSAASMSKIAPEVKALQAKYKGDPTKLNEMTMALYKERGVNPLASCLPMLLQMPILISVYWAITGRKELFTGGKFLWIGTDFAQNSWNHVLAASLVNPDYVLLAMYVVSMYFSFKLAAPATDPQQAQQQQMMAFISPVMIGIFGFQYKWPSALLVYWLSSNLFTMLQQFLIMRSRRLADAKEALKTPAIVNVTPSKGDKRLRSGGAAGATGGANMLAAAQAGGQGGGRSGAGAQKAGGNAPKTGGAKNGSGTNAAAKRRR